MDEIIVQEGVAKGVEIIIHSIYVSTWTKTLVNKLQPVGQIQSTTCFGK